MYIITIPSRTSRREFSVMGWSGSSGGLPSKRPSFPWLPSTAMGPPDRRGEVLSKAFWHLCFCLHPSEAKALLCLCNTALLPSPWDSLDTQTHHPHPTACIRLPCQICSNRPRPCQSHLLKPCMCFRGCLAQPTAMGLLLHTSSFSWPVFRANVATAAFELPPCNVSLPLQGPGQHLLTQRVTASPVSCS